MGLIFAVVIMLYTAITHGVAGTQGVMLVAAALIGGYMAMNIGANDVANNVGPAVGSKAVSMVGALVIAAVFEAAGALIAGGDVVSTIQKGIIRPDAVTDPDRFIWLMTAALLAAAVWLNIATAFGAPVSTTDSIIGAVLRSAGPSCKASSRWSGWITSSAAQRFGCQSSAFPSRASFRYSSWTKRWGAAWAARRSVSIRMEAVRRRWTQR